MPVRAHLRAAPAAAIAALPLLLQAAAAPAGVGSAVSAPAVLDLVPPVVVIEPLGPEPRVLGGDAITLRWHVEDLSLPTTADGSTAQLFFGSDVDTALAFVPADGPAELTWTAPDTLFGPIFLQVATRDAFGNVSQADGDRFAVVIHVADVPGRGGPAPAVALLPNVPNPFNPVTRVAFSLARAQTVELTVYGADGRLVRRLAAGAYGAGRHEVTWDGRDDAGRAAASGTYLLRLRAADATDARRVTLLK